MNCVTLVKGRVGGQLFATQAGWISLEHLKAETGLADDEVEASYFEVTLADFISDKMTSLFIEKINLDQAADEVVQVVAIIHDRVSINNASVKILNGIAYLDASLYDSVFC